MSHRASLLALSIGIAAGIFGCSTYTNVTSVQIISKIAGDSQVAIAGTVLPVRPGVQVTDSLGVPVTGVSVDFSVTSGGGTIGGATGQATAVTGADGIAIAGDWKIGSVPGTNDLTAAVSNASVHFVATGIVETTTHSDAPKIRQ
ncbi:MAG: hypothetical protein ACREK8_10005 [Gemmatimonadales bacterium]